MQHQQQEQHPAGLEAEQQREEQVDQTTLREYYKTVQQQIQQKFRVLTTDTLQEIKNKLRRKQDDLDQQENITLIQKQRLRIAAQMKQHLQQCFHPNCQQVDQIVILYDLFKHAQKQDPLPLIVRRNVKGLPKIETDCYIGSKINARMRETHRLLSGIGK